MTERAVPLGILPSHPPTAGALPKGEPFLFVNLMTLGKRLGVVFLEHPYKIDPQNKIFRNRSMVFSQRIELPLGDDGRKKCSEVCRAFAPFLQTGLCIIVL